MTAFEEQYLIIGGSTKCGTTSVFKYFEFHPQICKCVMKESRYFLEENYKLQAKQRNNNDIKSFSELFPKCSSGQIRLESTPDYLYSNNAANQIHKELKNVKLVFILREPVDRLLSWYKFSKLNGLIEKSVSLEEYIELQKAPPTANTPQHLKSLLHGRYSLFLKSFYNIFNKNNVLICFYEDLVNDPVRFCNEIAAFVNINTDYFKNYNFVVHNKSVPVKSVRLHRMFRKMKRTLRPATALMNKSIRKKLKLAGYTLETMYSNANRDQTESGIALTPEMNQYLNDYYKHESNAIYELSGVLPPWNLNRLNQSVNEN